MKIYSGSSNKALAEAISLKLGCMYGNLELSHFGNHENKVWIKDEVEASVSIVQSFSKPVDHHIVEFCLIADALNRLGVSDITAIIPWLGYSKQDKVFRSGEPLSVKVIANIIETSPINRIITLDLHNPAIVGFFKTPLVNVKARTLFEEYFQKKSESYCVVSPDAGAVKTSTEFANNLNLPLAYINKKRNFETGQVSIVDISRDIKNENILILDDMIATGATMMSVATFLKSKGAKSITIAATHHLYLDGVQSSFDSSDIDEVVVTNSVQKPENIKSSKLTILGVEQLIASNLKMMLK